MSTNVDNGARAAILAKIRALRARTTANGCTEAEAVAAAQKVAQLLQQYNITESDEATVQGDKYGAGRVRVSTGVHYRAYHPTCRIWESISELCNCYYFRNEHDLVVFGAEQDVQVMFFLIDLMKTTSESELRKFKRTKEARSIRQEGHHKLSIRTSFFNGFNDRVILRIYEIIKEREKLARAIEAANNKNTGLMVMRNQLIKSKYDNWLKHTGIKLHNVRIERTVRSEDAHAAGVRAGNNVHLGEIATRITGSAKRLN